MQVSNTTNRTLHLTGLVGVFVILTRRPGTKQKEKEEARGSKSQSEQQQQQETGVLAVFLKGREKLNTHTHTHIKAGGGREGTPCDTAKEKYTQASVAVFWANVLEKRSTWEILSGSMICRLKNVNSQYIAPL